MSQGRCSATIATVMVLCLLVLHPEEADATTYVVGGSRGWAFNTVLWPLGKRFAAGDTLVFKYNPSVHNVVAVNRVGYATCSVPRGSKVYRSGRDQIKLAKGGNYFICSVPGHCLPGLMKIAITAV